MLLDSAIVREERKASFRQKIGGKLTKKKNVLNEDGKGKSKNTERKCIQAVKAATTKVEETIRKRRGGGAQISSID